MKGKFFIYIFPILVLTALHQLNAQNTFSFYRIEEGCIIAEISLDDSKIGVIDTLMCDDCTIFKNILFTQGYLQTIDAGGSIVLSKYLISREGLQLLDRYYVRLPVKTSFRDFSFSLEGLNFLVLKKKYGIEIEKQLSVDLLNDDSLLDIESKISKFIEKNR